MLFLLGRQCLDVPQSSEYIDYLHKYQMFMVCKDKLFLIGQLNETPHQPPSPPITQAPVMYA